METVFSNHSHKKRPIVAGIFPARAEPDGPAKNVARAESKYIFKISNLSQAGPEIYRLEPKRAK